MIASWSDFIKLTLTIMSACLPIISIMWLILKNYLTSTLKIAMNEANQKQTENQIALLEKLRAEYIPSMGVNLTGAEVKHMFDSFAEELKDIRKAMLDTDIARLRHQKANATATIMLAQELAVMKALSAIGTKKE